MDQQPKPLTDRIAAALSEAGAFCGECGFKPGETGCPDCVRVREVYTKELLAVVQPDLDQRDAEIRRLREQDGYQREAINLMRSYFRKHHGDDFDAELTRHALAQESR